MNRYTRAFPTKKSEGVQTMNDREFTRQWVENIIDNIDSQLNDDVKIRLME